MRVATHFSWFLLSRVLLIFFTFLLLVVLLILPFLRSPLRLLIELIIIHSIKYILLDRHKHEIFQFLLQFLFFHAFFLLDLFFILPFLLDLLEVFLIFLLEVFVGLGQLIFCNFNQRLKFLSRVTSDHLLTIIAFCL